jgi:molybdenum cofactor guanylyltransferase
MDRIEPSHITGLVLCGGRGTRMGGLDKGLQLHQGLPLAQHALQRLAPQVGPLVINANRNRPAYEALGAPVWPDQLADFQGPLAGWLAGLARCRTPYLLTVPCDTPAFPLDLAPRLAAALAAADAQIAMAATHEDGRLQLQPVFCLLQAALMPSLQDFLAGGQRRVDRWTARHRCVEVVFEDRQAFFNANTTAELQSLQSPGA